jgi:hypothetical protein
MYYIHRQKDNLFHTLILKRIIDNYTYIIAIGYGGGGTYEEFCGKFKLNDENDKLEGLFSQFHNPDEWEKKSIELDVIDEPNNSINNEDKIIIEEMADEIWNDFLILEEESGNIFIRNEYLCQMKDNYLISEGWDDEVVAFVSNNFWGLSLTFEW